jgi:23S rRNA pseudouridine2605 synthase
MEKKPNKPTRKTTDTSPKREEKSEKSVNENAFESEKKGFKPRPSKNDHRPYNARKGTNPEANAGRRPFFVGRGDANKPTTEKKVSRPASEQSKDKFKSSSSPRNHKNQDEDIRLNKYIAHSGICSRRAADDLIKAGRIRVNSQIVSEPGTRIKITDKVYYDGNQLTKETRKVYILMNKPKNTICSNSDEKGRKTVVDIVGDKIEQRIYPVGRLDRDTTGLLLLTNDGDLAKKLSHPSYEISKVYHATLDRAITPEELDTIRTKGVKLEEGIAKVDDIQIAVGSDGTEVVLEVHIGWNRVVRRIFETLGYNVEKLDRVYLAGLTKKALPRGYWRQLTEQEIIMLKHFI